MTNLEHEQPPKPKKIIFYAGSSMEQHSNEPVKKELSDVFGPDVDIAAYPSAISSEILWVNRIEDMVKDLEDAVYGNQETIIVLYSLGASEFITALLALLDKRQKARKPGDYSFTPLDLSNIHIMLRSPAGLIQKWGDRARQFKQIFDMAVATVSGPSSQLEHVLTFPPNDGDPDALQLILDAYHHAHPSLKKQSLDQESPKTPYLPPQPIRKSWHTEEQKEQLAPLDEKLIAAAKNVETDPEGFKQALAARVKEANNLKIKVGNVLGNKDKGLTGPEWTKQKLPASPFALFGFFRIMGRSMAMGNSEVYKWLSSRGAKISWIIPTDETFSPDWTIEDFFGDTKEYQESENGEAKNRVSIPGSHITLTNRAKETVTAIAKLFRRAKQPKEN